MPAGGSIPRGDRAVIMARGLSSRMGVPKGLLRLSCHGSPFVRIIADLYLEAGIPVDVVTREETFDDYRRELPDCSGLRLLSAEAGGDTALTLLTAWRSCRSSGIPCSHLWAHPVDLPLVTADVVNVLRDCSQGNSERIIRPVRQDTPGHPVIIPGSVLAILEDQERFHNSPLRVFLSTSGGQAMVPAPVMVEVEDPGVVRDFDRPEDFSPDRLTGQKEGEP